MNHSTVCNVQMGKHRAIMWVTFVHNFNVEETKKVGIMVEMEVVVCLLCTTKGRIWFYRNM